VAIDLHTADALFHVPDLAQLEDTGTFSSEESRHVTGARRLRAGDELHVFDGAGTVARVAITQIDPRGRSTSFTLIERSRFESPKPRIALVAAVPKGDRQNTLLDMATQLGMTDYWPGLFERSVTRPRGINDRWQRIVLAGCKQSRRAFLPRLHDAIEIGSVAAETAPAQLVYADAGGKPVGECLEGTTGDITLVIGPEGGFTDGERELLNAAGERCLGVGDGILRTETAAVAALAAIQSTGLSARS